jgi:uncharacterized membrane protein YfcA
MLTQAVLALPALALVGLVAAFLFGGIVKGVVGIGLPLVLVPLTTQFLDVQTAIGLLTVPMIATNIGQAAEGGHTLPAIRRLAPILVTLVAGTLIGVHLLITIDRRLLNAILGVSFIALAGLLLCLPRVRLSGRIDRWAGPLAGFGAGLLGGLSAMFGPLMVAYMVGRGTDPDTFVKHMAIVAFTASATLLLALGGSGSMSLTDLLIAVAAIIPIQLGMPVGRWLRRRIKPEVFRVGVLVLLALGGLDMLHRALL